MSNFDWSKPHKQEPIGLLFFAAANIRKLFKMLLVILAPILFKIVNNEDVSSKKSLYTFGLLGVITLLVLINSAFSYWYYRFQISNDEFIINKGFLKKTKLSIPLNRIQTVNVKQNLIQQVFNIVTVIIDSAGATKEEIKITAVKRAVANAIQEAVKNDKILHEKNVIKTETETKAHQKETENTKKTKLILKLNIFDVAKVGLTQNHLKSLMLIFGVILYLFNQVNQISKNAAKEYSDKGIETIQGLGEGVIFWSFMAILVLFFAVLISFASSFIAFFNFKIQQQKNTFKVSFGLLSYREISVPLSKIQMLVINENPLRNLLNFKNIEFKQAISGNKQKKKQKIIVPACKIKQQKEIQQLIFESDKFIFSNVIKTHWIYFVRNHILFTLLLILPTIYFNWKDSEYWTFVAIYELVLISYLVLSYFRRGFRLSENVTEITKGSIEKNTILQHNFKLQAVKYSQSIIMKRRNLASLTLYSASGSNIKIPYISSKVAQDVQNFLLYKIERAEKAWM